MVASARGASDRYEILLKLASGGMGSVYIARMRGAMGFRQLVAIKKPHPHLLEDPKARQAFVQEAKLTSAVRHVNVVTMRDVDHHDGEVALVMDYVEGGSMIDLLRDLPHMPVPIAIRVALDACTGLHAAHEARDETGGLLAIVHRDVSPHNILVGIDGVTRVTDFGIAKALGTPGEGTASGGVKGKLAYMAPEYLQGERADRRVDIFALGVVLWEAVEGRRLFRGSNDLETLDKLLKQPLPPSERAGVSVNSVLRRALARLPGERYQTADEMAEALDQAARADGAIATQREVGAFVKERVGASLEARFHELREAHRKRQQTTGSMGAIVAAPAATGPSANLPGSLPRISQTIDMGASKDQFAVADSGLLQAGDTSQTPEPVEESLSTAAASTRRPSRGLLLPVAIAALVGSVAAVLAWRVTLPKPTVPSTIASEPATAIESNPPPPLPSVPSVATSTSSAPPAPSQSATTPARPKSMRIPVPATASLPTGPAPLRANPYETPSPR